jgi:hypothetical protein
MVAFILITENQINKITFFNEKKFKVHSKLLLQGTSVYQTLKLHVKLDKHFSKSVSPYRIPIVTLLNIYFG